VSEKGALTLDALELDALTELVNVGVSRAAASLRTMVGSEVLLSVPAVEMMTYEQAAKLIGERESGPLVGVHQSFTGDISGGAMLIFPETNSLELVRAITGGGLPLDDIIAVEQEALAETGNIILNGCLATIANMLRRTLKISLPEILHGSGNDIFSRSPVSVAGTAVLFLYIDFSVRNRNIKGYITMLMDLPSLAALKLLIGKMIEQATGEPSSSHAAH
jgi:chemotaxis protein CheC